MYKFDNLTHEIRHLMVVELEKDKNDNCFYLSQNFNPIGDQLCFEIARKAMLDGDENTFANALISHNCFGQKSKTGRTVPVNASELFAHNEFNRFYMRAVCLFAIANNLKIVIYRAKHSDSPREESERLIGKGIDASLLLEDLRKESFVEKALGLSKPNSGLSIKLLHLETVS